MSLTARVVVRALTVMALSLAGVALLTFNLVTVAGRNDVDRLAEAEAAQLAGTLGERVDAAVGLDGRLSTPELEGAARDALAVDPSGPRHVSRITLAGTTLQSDGGPPTVAALARGSQAPVPEPGSMRTIDTAAGPIRVLDQVVTDGDGKPIAVITVLAPLDDARSTAAGVLRRAAVAGLIGIGVGGAALLLVVRRSLGPLREVSAAASGVSSSDLTARVPVPSSKDEVAELAGELNHMLERIEDGDRGRRQLLAAVSHEVRTPLTIAEGHLELLERLGPTDGEDARRVAATVRGELERLRRLLDDILMVARGGESVEIDREPVFLPDLFAAVEQRLGARAGADRVEVDAPPPAVVLADGARLEQCLLNLVDNAVEHNPAGTSVRVGAVTSGDAVVLSVSDDGSGIAPALLPEVFEPFVTTRANRSGRPAGLGLAIVRSLIRAQGGDVTVDTGPTGTRVHLTLPASTD